MRFKTIFFISFFFCLFTTFGQQKIRGRVIGENLESVIGITIFDKDTTEIGKTDFNGYFEIELQKDYEKLIFAGVGYEWTNITIPKDCDNLEIVILLSGTYDFMSSNKIDRLRKKRFDKITELHSQAYKKGLFKTEEPCYNRKFKPIKPELDKITKRLKKLAEENKKDFKNLNIGDTVKIPFGINASEKRVRTTYTPCTDCTEKDFDYLIEGVIVNKNRRKLTIEIKITKMPFYDSLEYNGKVLNINNNFKYEMKYFEVIIDK